MAGGGGRRTAWLAVVTHNGSVYVDLDTHWAFDQDRAE